MKKTLTIILVLTMVMGGMIFAEATSKSSTLTLNYLKDAAAQYGIGWYAEQSDTATAKTDDSFNTAAGETVNVVAYLKVTSNFSSTLVSLSALLPDLKNINYSTDKGEDDSTIGYTVALSSTTSSTTTLTTTSLTSSLDPSGATTFATIPANSAIAQTSWVKFVFTPDSTDLGAATPNTSYTADVVVTMAST